MFSSGRMLEHTLVGQEFLKQVLSRQEMSLGASLDSLGEFFVQFYIFFYFFLVFYELVVWPCGARVLISCWIIFWGWFAIFTSIEKFWMPRTH